MCADRVFIVEDESILAEEISINLEAFDYQVVGMASTGEEALREINNLKPDIVLMDIMLSGAMDGIEAAQKIQDGFDIPVVYLTAYDDKATLDRARVTEPFGYILKPYSPRELNANIAMALYKSRSEKRLLETACTVEVFSNISDALLGLDKRGVIKLVNPAAESLFARQKEDLVDVHWSKILHCKDNADQLTLEKMINEHCESFFPDEAIDIDLLSDNEYGLSVEIGLCSIDNTKSAISLVLIAHDVTRRKAAENKLAAYQESLEQKVEERTLELSRINQDLDTYNYSVSHDLRSPLRSIDGFSNILQEDYAHLLDDEAKDYLSRICNASQRMGELIDDLLMLSRLSMEEMTVDKVNFSFLARKVMETFSERNPDRNIEFEIAPNMIVYGDTRLLRIVLENLVDNALKFTANLQAPIVEIGMSLKEGKPQYFVRDNGVGFNMEFSKKIFNVFQRLHSTDKYSGTGVGLAIVQRIIMKHHGQISAEGEVGKGACFYFTLDESMGDRKINQAEASGSVVSF